MKRSGKDKVQDYNTAVSSLAWAQGDGRGRGFDGESVEEAQAKFVELTKSLSADLDELASLREWKAKAVDLLRIIEWEDHGSQPLGPRCPRCKNTRDHDQGHWPTCPLAELLPSAKHVHPPTVPGDDIVTDEITGSNTKR
jgi:hypothetical protein